MACNPTTLLAAASCFQCLTAGEQQLIRIALFCRIANGVTMACDISTLLSESACYQCLPAGQLSLLEIALLCTIMTNGGGGGGGGSDQIKTYVADPNAEAVVPGTLNLGAVAYPTVAGAGPNYNWNTVTHVWE